MKSKKLLKRINKFLWAGIFVFFPFFLAKSETIPPCVKSCTYKSEKKLMRFFDLDLDGKLNMYEARLYQTHLIMKWPLANTQERKRFDYSNNWMLEPNEWAAYYRAHQNKKKLNVNVKI